MNKLHLILCALLISCRQEVSLHHQHATDIVLENLSVMQSENGYNVCTYKLNPVKDSELLLIFPIYVTCKCTANEYSLVGKAVEIIIQEKK